MFSFFRKKKYTVLTDEDIYKLILEVNVRIKEGWKCQGGIAQGANEYLQAMVK